MYHCHSLIIAGKGLRANVDLGSDPVFSDSDEASPLVVWVILVCLSLSLADSPLSVWLSGCQMTAGATRGPPVPTEAPFAVLCGDSPPTAVFQDHHTAVTANSPATRRGLSHKTSKASLQWKQVRGALSISRAPLLSDSSLQPLHTACTLFIHFSCCAVGDPNCAIHSADDMSKCLSYRIMLHITELSVKSFTIRKYVKRLCDE